jgi:serine O-acetyltransferase
MDASIVTVTVPDPVPREGVHAKIRADALAWGRIWKRPLTFGLWCRLLLLEPGFQYALYLRIQELVGRLPGGALLRRLVWYAAARRFGSDIDPQAVIGGGVRFPHPYGIVIGGSCVVGREVVILQNVTLGRLRSGEPSGPRIGDRAVLNAGCVIAGDLSVGEGAVVGANAFVRADVPAGHIAVGVPARNHMPRGAVSGA